jgi:hypothetical protein
VDKVAEEYESENKASGVRPYDRERTRSVWSLPKAKARR